MSDELSVTSVVEKAHSLPVVTSSAPTSTGSSSNMKFGIIMAVFAFVVSAGIVYVIFQQNQQDKKLRTLTRQMALSVQEEDVQMICENTVKAVLNSRDSTTGTQNTAIQEQITRLEARQDQILMVVQKGMNNMQQSLLGMHKRLIHVSALVEDEDEQEEEYEKDVVSAPATSPITSPVTSPTKQGQKEHVSELEISEVEADATNEIVDEEESHGSEYMTEITTPPKRPATPEPVRPQQINEKESEVETSPVAEKTRKKRQSKKKE